MNEGAGGDTPITVKCRIGVGDDDSYEQLATFIDEVRCNDARARTEVLHIRMSESFFGQGL